MTHLLSTLVDRLTRRTRGDDGATAVEYGLMVALIAGVIILAVTQLGGQVKGSFDKTCGSLQNANAAAPAANAPDHCTP